MRDIILSAFMLALLPMILFNPLLGAYAWAWVSLMNPHRLTYGFAYTLPFALATAAATLVGFLLVRRRRKPFPWTSITVAQVGLFAWMTLTTFFAVQPEAGLAWERWVFIAKIQLMLFVTMMLVRGQRDINRLIWLVTISVGFYGVKGGVATVLSGGSVRIWGPSGTLFEDNNHLAVVLVMMVPMMYYLYQLASTSRWVRRGLVAAMALTSMAILGSQSRGALLALLAMAALLGLKGRYPVRSLLVVTLAIVLAIGFMPESWTTRMDTIGTYQDDNSAMSRLYTWKTLWNCALARPVVGCGFSADNLTVFETYAPTDAIYAEFRSQGTVLVAHSIYFQLLGEHGFPGLLLFLAIGFAGWRRAGQLAVRTKSHPEFSAWVPKLMPMVQVSLFGFAIGGAFLSLGYCDVPYYIVSFVVLVDVTVTAQLRRESSVRGVNAPLLATTAS